MAHKVKKTLPATKLGSRKLMMVRKKLEDFVPLWIIELSYGGEAQRKALSGASSI